MHEVRLLCPYCFKQVLRVEGSKQFNHVNITDFRWCGKIPDHAIEREASHETK